jgi:hypothetical protein
MGALTQNHRCPPSTWFNRITDALTTVMIGSVAGGLFVFAVEEQPTGALVLASAALGVVLASAVRQAIGGPKS